MQMQENSPYLLSGERCAYKTTFVVTSSVRWHSMYRELYRALSLNAVSGCLRALEYLVHKGVESRPITLLYASAVVAEVSM
jgi:hypothetical protein